MILFLFLSCTEHINCYTKPSASAKALAHFSSTKLGMEFSALGGGKPSGEHRSKIPTIKDFLFLNSPISPSQFLAQLLRHVTKRHLGYDLPYIKKAYRVLDILVPTRNKRNVLLRNRNTSSSNRREKIGEAGASQAEEAVYTALVTAEPQAPTAGLKDDAEEATTTSRPDITL